MKARGFIFSHSTNCDHPETRYVSKRDCRSFFLKLQLVSCDLMFTLMFVTSGVRMYSLSVVVQANSLIHQY